MDVDLDLSHYDLNDILELFKLQVPFSTTELKHAKKVVYKLHPDKCDLDEKYFIFFAKAYKKLHSIYHFMSQKNITQSPEYQSNTENIPEMHKQLMKEDDFLNNFNKMFDEIYDQSSNDAIGYGDWLKSEDDLYTPDTDINQLKKSLTVQQEIEYTTNGSNQCLSYENQSYQSDPFSKLQYDDLRKVHTETIVPVTTDDYNKIRKFGSMDELKQHRQITHEPMSVSQSKQYLHEFETHEAEKSASIAFDLYSKQEDIKQRETNWWSKYKQLKNSSHT